MGIIGFFKLINDFAPKAIVKRRLADYRDRRVAIDAMMAIRQWCSVGVYRNIRNKQGKYINHIQGTFFRTLKMLEAGIIPQYIFDGPPPPSKGPTIAARKAVEGRIKVPTEVYDECKRLLDLMGVPWMVAPSEAEAQAAAMTKRVSGISSRVIPLADAVSTEDSDALVFGAQRIVRGLELSANSSATEISLDSILESLGLTYESFVDLCILMGSDYTEGTIPGIGPRKALILIKKYKTIEGILEGLNIKAGPDFDYVEARDVFLNHKVNVNIAPAIVRKLSNNDLERLQKYLIEVHGLDKKKVDNGIAKLRVLQAL